MIFIVGISIMFIRRAQPWLIKSSLKHENIGGVSIILKLWTLDLNQVITAYKTKLDSIQISSILIIKL